MNMIPPGCLVKFCKSEHNILDRCHTIRFGTLEYYRELDPSFLIADAEEGIESTDIGLFEFGTSSMQATEVVSKGIPWIPKGPTVRLQNCAIHTTVPNCYVWCCSVFPNPVPLDYGKNFDQQYSSYYTITNPVQFAERLAGMLNNYISLNKFSDSIKEAIRDFSMREINEIFLGVIHSQVIYVDKKVSVIDEGQYLPYVKNLPEQFRPLFVKTDNYKENYEYRFVFWFEHRRRGKLAVGKDPVDIPILPIASA